jgi:hypothetical protein
MPSPWQILGLEPGTALEEVRKQYRRRVLRHHPDKNPGNEKESTRMMVQLQAAYESILPKPKPEPTQTATQPPSEKFEDGFIFRPAPHSNWEDGPDRIEEMIRACQEYVLAPSWCMERIQAFQRRYTIFRQSEHLALINDHIMPLGKFFVDNAEWLDTLLLRAHRKRYHPQPEDIWETCQGRKSKDSASDPETSDDTSDQDSIPDDPPSHENQEKAKTTKPNRRYALFTVDRIERRRDLVISLDTKLEDVEEFFEHEFERSKTQSQWREELQKLQSIVTWTESIRTTSWDYDDDDDCDSEQSRGDDDSESDAESDDSDHIE